MCMNPREDSGLCATWGPSLPLKDDATNLSDGTKKEAKETHENDGNRVNGHIDDDINIDVPYVCCDKCGDHQENDLDSEKLVSLSRTELHPALVQHGLMLWLAMTKLCLGVALYGRRHDGGGGRWKEIQIEFDRRREGGWVLWVA